MTGLKESIAILNDWNAKWNKLTHEDIVEIAMKFSAGNPYLKPPSRVKLTVEERARRVIDAGGRLTISQLKSICGKKISTVLSYLKKNGYTKRIEHEFHGNSPITYHVFENEAKTTLNTKDD